MCVCVCVFERSIKAHTRRSVCVCKIMTVCVCVWGAVIHAGYSLIRRGSRVQGRDWLRVQGSSAWGYMSEHRHTQTDTQAFIHIQPQPHLNNTLICWNVRCLSHTNSARVCSLVCKQRAFAYKTHAHTHMHTCQHSYPKVTPPNLWCLSKHPYMLESSHTHTPTHTLLLDHSLSEALTKNVTAPLTSHSKRNTRTHTEGADAAWPNMRLALMENCRTLRHTKTRGRGAEEAGIPQVWGV